MATSSFNWTEFEDALFEELRWSLVRLGKKHPKEVFYVVALYGLYRELDGLLSLPLLGANTTASSAANDGGEFWSPRWNPADWEHEELPLRKQPALRLERALTREATAGSPTHWRATEKRYFGLLVRVARRLRDLAPELLTVSDDFVAFVHDEDGGATLARKTIPKRRFEALFSKTVATERERSAVRQLGPSERAAFLVTRFGCYDGVTSEDAQQELFAIGAPAVPRLLGVLDDPRNGWAAARLLGEIGIASKEVIGALRKQAPRSMWHAMALGVLGDHDWLARARDPALAVTGLTAPLRSITTRRRCPPLRYQALEAYLARAGKAAEKKAERELEPGSGYTHIGPNDVDEALRGLTSRHAVIRWHAASVLGDRGLGQAAGKQILPALASCLGDRNRLVRRLAILSMSRWKAASKPFKDAIATVQDDPDQTVRSTARKMLGRR